MQNRLLKINKDLNSYNINNFSCVWLINKLFFYRCYNYLYKILCNFYKIIRVKIKNDLFYFKGLVLVTKLKCYRTSFIIIRSYKRKVVNTGSIIVRATVNNFFLTFIRTLGLKDIGIYISSGMIDRTMTRKKRSEYVAKIACQNFFLRVLKKFRRVRYLYLFIYKRLCRRSQTFIYILRRLRYYFIVKIIIVKGKAHNGLRGKKPRRLKKLN